jgi:hypothetical protein
MALQIRNNLQPGDTIVINGKYERGSTLNYYIGRQVYVLNGRDGNLWFGSFFSGAPDVFLDDASFARLWSGTNRVFFFTEDYMKDEATRNLAPASIFVFATQGGKFVLTNRPVSPGPPQSQFSK